MEPFLSTRCELGHRLTSNDPNPAVEGYGVVKGSRCPRDIG